MKEQTLLSIDGDLKKLAKERGFNFSEIFEDALRKRLEYKEIRLDKVCFFCNTPRDRLMWLFPDEKWICDRCLKAKKDKALVGKLSQ